MTSKQTTTMIAPTPNRPYKCAIAITFPKDTDAEYAKKALEVDEEPSEKVLKTYALQDNVMHVEIEASEAKMLRVGVSSFYDFFRYDLEYE